jgi:SPP1 gp7 family putative phage head morphogenesis protein
LRQQFDQQRRDILGNAGTSQLKGYVLRDVSQQDKKDYLAALLLWSAYDHTMRLAIAPILYTLIVEIGKQATKQINLDPSMFDPTTLAILNYHQQRASKIATDVNAETEKQLRASLSQGIDNGESDDELQARIELVMGAALTYRADRITRTEVTRAQSFADNEAWKQSGMVTGKEWYTVIDERTCLFCNSLDGTIISLDSDFFSLGDVMTVDGKTMAVSYDDIAGPPAHVNCRCSELPVSVNLGDL